MMTTLQERARNCIVTILELAPQVGSRFRDCFAADFAQLGDSLCCIDSMNLAEDDVVRLELLTQSFLREAGGFCHCQRHGGRQ